MSHEANHAADAITRIIRRVTDLTQAFRAIATGGGSGKASVRRLSATTAESVPRIVGYRIESGDEVLVVPINGRPVVIGKIIRANPTREKLEIALELKGDSTTQFLVEKADGTDIVVIDTTNGELIATKINTPIFEVFTADSATDSTNASTSVWDDARTFSLTLPAGTWTVTVYAHIQVQHSGSGTADVRTEIDGTAGSNPTSSAAPSTGFYTFSAGQTKTGVAGGASINLKIQFKANTAGTVTVDQPGMFAIARRTA